MTEFDLFGEAEPVRKKTTSYVVELSQMDWPDHLLFWCLSAEPRPKKYPPDSTEMVCFRSEFYWVHAAVNIHTGRILKRVRQVPHHQPQIRGRKKATPAG